MKGTAGDNLRSELKHRDGFSPPVHIVYPLASYEASAWDSIPPIPCLVTQDGFAFAKPDTLIRLAWRNRTLFVEANCVADQIVSRPDLAADSPDFWMQDHIELRTAPDPGRDLLQVQLIIASDGRSVLVSDGGRMTRHRVVTRAETRRLAEGMWEWRISAEVPFDLVGLGMNASRSRCFRGLIARVRWKGESYETACTTACELGFAQAERFGEFRLSENSPAVRLAKVGPRRIVLIHRGGEGVTGLLEVARICTDREETYFRSVLHVEKGGKTEIAWTAPLEWPAFTCLKFVWRCEGMETELGRCTFRGEPEQPEAGWSRAMSRPYLLFGEKELSAIRSKLALSPFREMLEEEQAGFDSDFSGGMDDAPEASFDITPNCMNWFRVARETMLRDGEGARNPAARRLWDAQSKLAKEAWRVVAREISPSRETVSLLIKEFNGLLRMRNLYDPRAFERVRLPAEGRAMLARGIDNLSEKELVRFNRILMQSSIECMHPFRMDLVMKVGRLFERWLVTDDKGLIDRATLCVKGAVALTIPGHETHLHEGMASAALALAYDAFHSMMTDVEREMWVRLMRRFLDLYLETARRRSWTVTTIANANPVGNAGGGLLALALWKECPEQAKDALYYARVFIRKWLNWCNGPDGGNTEGAQYWTYGTEHFLRFAVAFERFSGHGDGLLWHSAIPNMMNMVRVGLCNDGALHGVNDTIPMPVGGHLGWFVAGRYGDALGLWYGDHAWRWYRDRQRRGLETPYRPTLADALLYRPAVPEMKKQPDLPLCYRLSSIEYTILRSSSKFDCVWTAGLKGSRPPYTHHNQPDTGSMYLDLRGERLLLDPGYYKDNPADHCLPLIGGKGPVIPRGFTGPVVECEERDDVRWIGVDSTAAYKSAARRVVRRLAMIGERAVVLIDDIDADADVLCLLQCGGPVNVEDNNRLIVQGEKARLGIRCFGPECLIHISEERSLCDVHWGYRFAEARWFPVTVAYRADVTRPFVVIFSDGTERSNFECSVEYRDGEILLWIETGRVMRLVRAHAGWLIW